MKWFFGQFIEYCSMVSRSLSRYSGKIASLWLLIFLKKVISNRLVSLVIFLIISYLAIYYYIDTSHNWVKLGSGITLFNYLIYYVEIPFAVFATLFFFFPSIDNPWFRYILPIAPVLVLYGLIDGFFNYMGRSPHFSDFQNFNTVFEFSFSLALSVFLFATLIPLSIWGLIYTASKSGSKRQVLISVTTRAALMTLMIFILSSETFNQLHAKTFHYTVWSEEDTLRENGKVVTVLNQVANL